METADARVEPEGQPPDVTVHGCPNCGSALVRRYCPDCGQSAPKPDDYSLRAHVADFIDLFTNLDGKVTRTVWTLVTRPGVLTADHLAGRRARYLRPLQLFILVNVLLFIVAPKVPFFSYSLDKYLRYAPPSPALVTRLVHDAVLERLVTDTIASTPGTVITAFAASFDSRVETQRKSLIILFVPVLALVLTVVFARTSATAGVPSRYGEHLVFAMHLVAFIWLVFAASYAIGSLPREPLPRLMGFALFSIIVGMLLGAPLYALVSVRRVYRVSWLAAVGVTVALAGAFTLLLVAYRGLLFFTTFYSM